MGVSFAGLGIRSSCPDAFRQYLNQKLVREGIEIADQANFWFKGEISPMELTIQEGKQVIGILCTGKISERLGALVEIRLPEAIITNPREVSEILCLPFARPEPPNDDPGILIPSFKNPKIFIMGRTQARVEQNSPFGLEVLVGAKAREIRERHHLGYITLRKGEEYVIRLVNDAPYEVAVAVAVDGLSVFHFSEVR